MRKGVCIGILSILLFSCGEKREPITVPPSLPQSHLFSKGSGSGELPITPNVDVNKLDKCTKYLLFTDQYITASDYPQAEDSLKEASKYCSLSDPRFNYMKAVLFDIEEQRDKAYRYYYKAAKEYIKLGKADEAFKCYSGMLSINPDGKEVKELKPYFEDDDY